MSPFPASMASNQANHQTMNRDGLLQPLGAAKVVGLMQPCLFATRWVHHTSLMLGLIQPIVAIPTTT